MVKRRDNKERTRLHERRAMLKRYGLTIKAYNDFLDSQLNCCAICEKEPKEGERRLAVDHDHETGRVRGLLCSACNIGLGMFKDDRRLLSEAWKYLHRKRRM